MKIPIQTNISYLAAGLTVFVVLFLAIFCEIVDYPLIIPLLFLFIGLHLFFVKKAKIKLFLHLGLLTTLLLFSIHAFKEYFKIPLALPVSYFAMLTMGS